MKTNHLITTTLILFVTIIACKKTSTSTTYDCAKIIPTYTTDIKPIMDLNCATSSCHSASAKTNGKDYSSYASTKALATDKAYLGSMQHLSGYDAMPKNASKLSDANLQKIYCWIQNGMPQ
ncbi:MAG: hypothetical protein H7331_02800 [Bacteroidia bacterium]|nr:hypothetical protein [Bacteroidia bacterium]